jgi:hypothetical protein
MMIIRYGSVEVEFMIVKCAYLLYAVRFDNLLFLTSFAPKNL